MKKIIILSITLFIFLINNSIAQVQQQAKREEKSKSVFVGLGAATWMLPEQSPLTKKSMPFHLNFEYKTTKGFSFLGDLGILSSYSYDFLTVNPVFFSFDMKYSFGQLLGAKKIDIFPLLGINYWTANLKYNEYSYKESDKGIGFDVAGGISYITKGVKLETYFLYQSSGFGADFYAGSYDKQKCGVGSFQVVIALKYDILNY